ncbi:MAG: co-chaperone GroES [Candidatus Yonathbacteria bacterium]|nr:co-chaperone GroES [Candidatus Yonathbacteria bacterium]
MATKKQSADKTTIVPLGDRVVVRALDPHEHMKTASGIFIPETVDRERPEQGTVVAVGEGRLTDEGKRIPVGVKKGDLILFSKYGPDEVKINGEEYYILGESSILAIIKK